VDKYQKIFHIDGDEWEATSDNVKQDFPNWNIKGKTYFLELNGNNS
jgi:hypothetical protein